MLIDYYDVWCTTDSDTYSLADSATVLDHPQPSTSATPSTAASCTEGIHHSHVLLSLSALLFAVPPYFFYLFVRFLGLVGLGQGTTD